MSITTGHLYNNTDLGTLLQPNSNLYIYNFVQSSTLSINVPSNFGSFTFTGATGYYTLNMNVGILANDSPTTTYPTFVNISTTSASINTDSDLVLTTLSDGSIPCTFSYGSSISGYGSPNFIVSCYSQFVKFITNSSGYNASNIWSGGTFFVQLTNGQTYYVNTIKPYGTNLYGGYINITILGSTIVGSTTTIP